MPDSTTSPASVTPRDTPTSAVSGEFRFPLPLHCPCCGAPLETERLALHERLGQFGILHCDCARYPVIADIPILLRGRLVGSQSVTPRLCRLLEAGKMQSALTEAAYPGAQAPAQEGLLNKLLPAGWVARQERRRRQRCHDAWSQVFESMLLDGASLTAAALFDLYFGSRGINDINTRDYFTYRWTQPRHLVALGLAGDLDIGAGAALDVGCGAGHVTRFLTNSARDQAVLGFDRHFFLLFVARHCVAPSASFVCGDAAEGLPFHDDAFTTVMSVNTFHFLRGKTYAAAELKRVLGDQGHLVLAALRQRFVAHSTNNVAVSPTRYGLLFSDMNTLLFDDAQVLDAYVGGRTPARAEAVSPRDLNATPLLSLIATRRSGPILTGQVLSPLPHALGRLDINPLYRVVSREPDGSLLLRRQFPSRFYSEENREMIDYTPEEVRLAPDVVNALDAGRHIPEMDTHIQSCVIIDLPERYGGGEGARTPDMMGSE